MGEREPLERLMHIAHAANERVPADSPQLLAQGAARHGKAVAGENDMCGKLRALAVARQGNDGDGPALRVVRKDDDGAVAVLTEAVPREPDLKPTDVFPAHAGFPPFLRAISKTACRHFAYTLLHAAMRVRKSDARTHPEEVL